MGEVLAIAYSLSEPQAMDIIAGDFNWDYLCETRNLILSGMYGFHVASSGPTATLADNVTPRAEYSEAIDFMLYRNAPADLSVRARRVLTGHVRGRRVSDHAGVVCTFFRQPMAARADIFPVVEHESLLDRALTRASQADVP